MDKAGGRRFISLSQTLQIPFLIVCLCLAWGWAVYDSIAFKTETFAQAEHALQLNAHEFEDNVTKTISLVDVQLQAFDELYRQTDLEGQSKAEVALIFARLAKSIRGVRAFAFMGADGMTLHSAVLKSNGELLIPEKSFNASKRSYFRHFADNWSLEKGQQLHIGQPIKGAVTGDWSLPLVRSRANVDGTFGGIVLMTIKLDQFYKLFDLQRHTSISSICLTKLDGQILAHQPFHDDLINTVMPTQARIASDFDGQNEGTFRGAGHFIEGESIVSFEKLKDYPVRIVISKGVSDIRNAIKMHMLFNVWVAVLLSLAVAALLLSIFKQRRTEQELRASEREARNYLSIAATIIIALDKTGCIKLINDSGCACLGYEREDLIGKNWFEVCLPENERVEVFGVFQDVMNGNVENIETYENSIVTKTGETRLISWKNSLLQGNGDIEGVLSSGVDVTDHRKMEETIQQSQKMDALGNLAAFYSKFVLFKSSSRSFQFYINKHLLYNNLEPHIFLAAEM